MTQPPTLASAASLRVPASVARAPPTVSEHATSNVSAPAIVDTRRGIMMVSMMPAAPTAREDPGALKRPVRDLRRGLTTTARYLHVLAAHTRIAASQVLLWHSTSRVQA